MPFQNALPRHVSRSQHNGPFREVRTLYIRNKRHRRRPQPAMSSGTHLKLCRERFGHSDEITGPKLLLCSARLLQVCPSLSGQPPSPLELPPRGIWTPYNQESIRIMSCMQLAEKSALLQVHMHCSSFPTWTPAGGREAMAAQPLREQLIRKWHGSLPMRGLSAHPGHFLQQQSVSLHPVCAVRASHRSNRSQHCPNSAPPSNKRNIRSPLTKFCLRWGAS